MSELAWAAGFFDGEGTIFVNHKRNRGEPKREQIERVWAELESLKTAKSPALPLLPGRAA